MEKFDVIIIGAGAAGMMCAIEAGRRGRRVVLLDHARAPGEKIRISGGGRCNFTNIHAGPKNYLSQNPHFCKSALKRYSAADFIAKVKSHNIAYHEKALGQLFCDGSAKQIITMLIDECREAGVELRLSTEISAVEQTGALYRVRANNHLIEAPSLVIATGGKSIPKMGATDFAYRIAAQFGLDVVETRPALAPLTFAPDLLNETKALSGVSVDAHVSCNGAAFREALLFTHRGISGPSILQISSFWREGDELAIDLAPQEDISAHLRRARQQSGKSSPQAVLAQWLPKRLAEATAKRAGVNGNGPPNDNTPKNNSPEGNRNNKAHAKGAAKAPHPTGRKIGEYSGKRLDALTQAVKNWRIKPVGSEGYRTAEVTLGGVDTNSLSSKTMEARGLPGLYFIGEAVDVTGWLGGYNFQWAWSSAFAAGQVV